VAGHEARHITAGTYWVRIDDESPTLNFRLKDLTFQHWPDFFTEPAFVGTVYWQVTFEATDTINGDYEFAGSHGCHRARTPSRSTISRPRTTSTSSVPGSTSGRRSVTSSIRSGG